MSGDFWPEDTRQRRVKMYVNTVLASVWCALCIDSHAIFRDGCNCSLHAESDLYRAFKMTANYSKWQSICFNFIHVFRHSFLFNKMLRYAAHAYISGVDITSHVQSSPESSAKLNWSKPSGFFRIPSLMRLLSRLLARDYIIYYRKCSN